VGLVAAVGGVAVQVVAVVAASGWQREQVVDVKATGSVQSWFQRWQGLAHLEGGVGASKGVPVCTWRGWQGYGRHCPATVRVKNIKRN